MASAMSTVRCFYRNYTGLVEAQAGPAHAGSKDKTPPRSQSRCCRARPQQNRAPHRAIQDSDAATTRRPPQPAPSVFLVAFFIALFFEARLLSLELCEANLLTEAERVSLAAVASALYLADGLLLLLGCFVDCKPAFSYLLQVTTCGIFEKNEDAENKEVTMEVGESEEGVFQSWAERCISEEAVDILLEVELCVFLVAFWPAAFAWVVYMWAKDGVDCGETGEEAGALAPLRDGREGFAQGINEKTPLFGKVTEIHSSDEEEKGGLGKAKVEENREMYARMMGTQSAYP